jgi:hypothetical protein
LPLFYRVSLGHLWGNLFRFLLSLNAIGISLLLAVGVGNLALSHLDHLPKRDVAIRPSPAVKRV